LLPGRGLKVHSNLVAALGDVIPQPLSGAKTMAQDEHMQGALTRCVPETKGGREPGGTWGGTLNVISQPQPVSVVSRHRSDECHESPVFMRAWIG